MFLETFSIYLQFSFLFILGLCQRPGLNVVTKPLLQDENMYMEIVEPEEVRFTFKIKPAKDFGTVLNSTFFNLELVPTDPDHGCSPISNKYDIEGAVALIVRGGCSFLSKTIHAEKAGALMVIIMDNELTNNERMIDMIEDGTERSTQLPSFFMLGKDGHMIKQAIQHRGIPGALINIPLNVTGIPFGQPPWTLW